MHGAGDVRADVPMDVADGVEDVWYAAGCLAEAVECVSVAVGSLAEDSTEYIEGTMSVLLQAARAVRDETDELMELVTI